MTQGAQLEQGTVSLPAPAVAGNTSLEQLLHRRRSVRDYRDAALDLAQIGQLLWAAQGITHPDGLRTAPSAGALYPLDLYLVAGRVEGMSAGVYHYDPTRHQLRLMASGDQRKAVAQAALGQSWMNNAAAVVAFTAVFARTNRKYGARGERYVHLEAGHAAENLFLQAEALGLGSVIVGAFDDAAVARVLQLPREAQPLILMPVGRRE